MIDELFEGRCGQDALEWARAGSIGDGEPVGPNGVPLVYADYVASGRALMPVEHFIIDRILPFYANTHSEDSFCGAFTTHLREEARRIIADAAGAADPSTFSVIFTGSGSTSGLNRLVSLFGVTGAGADAIVFLGPYEHHSNILPWRESGATIVNVPEAEGGGPDLQFLDRQLRAHAHHPLKIGAFSAASNVSGIRTDPVPVTALLKAHGALAAWDYAAAAPYVAMSMQPAETAPIDAIAFSPHKFPGGPGATGILVVRNAAVMSDKPTWPGGGTVRFVSAHHTDYLEDIAAREEAGTPNIVGDIRAGIAVALKQRIGVELIERRERELNQRALEKLGSDPNLLLLGTDRPNRIPIFSFEALDRDGRYVDPSVFTRALSERYGIQARGGCSCAGIYGHRLLAIDDDASESLREQILAGDSSAKPGWVRLNFSYLMSDDTADFIIRSVKELAADFREQSGLPSIGSWMHSKGDHINGTGAAHR